MIKLLVLTPSHSVSGGAERMLENLASCLPSRGFEVVFGLGKGARFNQPGRFLEVFPQVRATQIDGATGTREGRRRSLRRALDDLRPDVVLVCRMFDGLEAVSSAKLAGLNTRLVVTVFSNEPEYVYDVSLYAPFVDLCVTDGRLAAEVVARLTGLPARVIPGGVRPPIVKRVQSREGGPLRVGYVGRLDQEQKRILDLPPILARLRARDVSFSCRIAGSGGAEGVLRESLRAHGLEGAVQFEGLLPREALYERVYPELDVFLHCAAWEGNPIAPREAMVHGVVPVVSRFKGSVVEGVFLGGRNSLLFDVGDTKGAATSIARLHGDRDLLRKLSREAERSCGAGFSTEAGAEAWANALTEVRVAAPRLGGRLPQLSHAPSGRLERLGIPSGPAETLRRILGRRFLADEPGAEWPHWSGEASPEELGAISQLGARIEEEARSTRVMSER